MRGVEFNRRVLSDVALANFDVQDCTFTNGWIRRGSVQNVRLKDSRLWACGLEDLIVERCVVDGVTAHGPRGGRRMPLILWGLLVSEVVLKGTMSALVWNPSRSPASRGDGASATAREFYRSVNWALDITEARFLSVPSLRFGPPGRLIRRDGHTQPLVTREAAASGAWRGLGPAIGIWRTVLANFLRTDWPDEIVLVPAAGGPRKQYEQQLAGIAILRDAGIVDA